MVAVVSLIVFVAVVFLYAYVASLLSARLSPPHATVVLISVGVLVVYLSLDVVHALVDSYTLLSTGYKLRGFEACG